MNSLVQTPTNRLAQSLDFYKKLNFSVVAEGASTIVSDGNVTIEINPERIARAGVKLYAKDWTKEIELLKRNFAVIASSDGYLLNSPSGCWIYLVIGQGSPLNIPKLENSELGNFAGVSLETISMPNSIEFWKTLEFEITMGGVEQGWVSLENEAKFGISLMKANSCPHLFFNPSLTFFNGKVNNRRIISKIRSLDIPITEEITVFNKEGIVDNVIIRDPGGLGFFIFNDE